jgi:putative phosphoribosyl transferase
MAAYFLDRRDAGRKLAAALMHLRDDPLVVLALPRGGVPVGFEIARALDAPLDVLVVRKIGAPGQPELGIGAIVDGAPPKSVLNPELIRMTGAGPAHIAAVEERERAEIVRRRGLYRGGPFPDLARKVVLVVDDGIATGGTMKAALAGLRDRDADRLIVAVPVAAEDTLRSLATHADDIVCLTTPEPFQAVGAHYRDFDQTSDEEVVALLREAAVEGKNGVGRTTG